MIFITSFEQTCWCCRQSMDSFQRARGAVVSHPLSMREALGSIPSVSMLLRRRVNSKRRRVLSSQIVLSFAAAAFSKLPSPRPGSSRSCVLLASSTFSSTQRRTQTDERTGRKTGRPPLRLVSLEATAPAPRSIWPCAKKASASLSEKRNKLFFFESPRFSPCWQKNRGVWLGQRGAPRTYAAT